MDDRVEKREGKRREQRVQSGEGGGAGAVSALIAYTVVPAPAVFSTMLHNFSQHFLTY